MADIADITTDRAEREAPYLLAASRRPSGPVAMGICHWCEEPLAGEARFCDAGCRDDYQRFADRLEQNRACD